MDATLKVVPISFMPTSCLGEMLDKNQLPLRIGIIGDFDPDRRSHTVTNEALHHAAKALSVILDIAWLPTQKLENAFSEMKLECLHALWCAPGSPYKSTDGALKATQFAREEDWPFLGT